MQSQTILDDEFGYVFHWPSYLDADKATSLYETLRDGIQWRQAHVRMYGKDYYPDRSISAQGSEEVRAYHFAGTTVAADEWTPEIRELADELQETLGLKHKINYALLNYYHNGSSKLGYHSDSEKDLVPGAPILSISLGTPRDFLIKANPSSKAKKKHNETIEVLLNPGDLLIMAKNTQKHFKHSVPERVDGGSRINITFRTMRPEKSKK